MNSKYASIIIITVIVCASIVGYLSYRGALSGTATEPTELRIFVASSLINVVNNMTAQFEKDNNVKLVINQDSSSTLYTQITSGSPCDVFMSADQKWTRNLNKTSPGLLNNQYVNFTTNSLEVILAPGNPAGITTLADLVKPGVKIVVAAPSVPAGSYANSTVWKIQSKWGPARRYICKL